MFSKIWGMPDSAGFISLCNALQIVNILISEKGRRSFPSDPSVSNFLISYLWCFFIPDIFIDYLLCKFIPACNISNIDTFYLIGCKVCCWVVKIYDHCDTIHSDCCCGKSLLCLRIFYFTGSHTDITCTCCCVRRILFWYQRACQYHRCNCFRGCIWIFMGKNDAQKSYHSRR